MDKVKARDLFAQMLRIRLVEVEISQRYLEQQMRCPTHLSVGQEAIPVGVVHALRPEDYMMSGHRAHAHYLAKGGSLLGLVAELYGKEVGCARGQGGSMHLVDLEANFLGSTSIISGTIPVTVGTAFGTKLKKEKRVSVAFFGDAALEEGVTHEAMNFASLHKLPVLFCCENNGYSCHTPLRLRQPNRPLTDLAKGHGIKTYSYFGNDLYDLCEKLPEIVRQIREGEGPAFVEFQTYRYLEHCGPNNDDFFEYRPTEEIYKWRQNDPIRLGIEKLKQMGAYSPEWEVEITQKIKQEIKEVFQTSLNAPFPPLEQLGAFVYAE